MVTDLGQALAIAARTGVRNASPQVLLLRNGRAVWDTAFAHIEAERLASAVNELVTSEISAPPAPVSEQEGD